MVATATLLSRSIQGESLSAATDRLANFAFKQGVLDFPDDSFEVLQDTGSNMVIKIGSGTAFDRAVIEGDNAGQGITIAEHQNATQTLSIAASDPTNDRIDRVVVRVYDDTFDSSGDDFSDLEVIEGTPDASPAAPAEPASSYTLATILVQDGVTQIVDGDITDLRFEAPLRGSLVQTIVYTSSSSFVKADHPWLALVKIIATASGGGGGAAGTTSTNEIAAGSGGGAGGTAFATVLVAALSASETVTVGADGVGGTGGAAGGAGNTTSFGAHAVAAGGAGGSAGGPGAAISVSGGVGGTVSAGDIQVEGGGGGAIGGLDNRIFGGAGGNSYWGGGARGRGTNGVGINANGYGGGGGGAAIAPSQSGVDGGDGAGGIIVLELYA